MKNDPRGHRIGFKESKLHIGDPNPCTWTRGALGKFTPSEETNPDGNRSVRRAARRRHVLDLRAEGKLTQERNPAPMGG